MTRIRALATALLLLSSCAHREAAPAVAPIATPRRSPPIEPRVVLAPEGRDEVIIRVEVARTPEQRRRGLQLRTRLAPDAGMLFVYPSSSHRWFWMRDTLLPLDIVFIASAMEVLGVVENAEPRTDDAREVPGLSQYVLEIGGGLARQYGIEAGTPVRFEGIRGVPPPNAARADAPED